MNIAITGSTGQLGRLVVQELKERGFGERVVALARDTHKAADLGVSVRQADYDAPATLDSALSGIDTLLLISASEVGRRLPQHLAVIEAAQKSGVKHIVYTSILHADVSILGLADEHRATEEALRASGLSYTFLRNGWYTENYTAGIPGALAAGVLAGSAGDGRISSATRADFAAAAAVVLSTANHENKTYELAGDESYTLTQLAEEISRQSGKQIPYTDLPPAEYAQLLERVGLPPAIAQLLADSDAGAAKGALFDDGGDLHRLLGRPTANLASAVAAALSA